MSLLVVDSSVVVKWFIPESLSEQARLILNDFQTGELDPIAPDLLNAEVGNIIWKKQQFQGLAANDAQTAMDAFRSFPFRLTPTAELLDDAYRLAVTHQRTVYDMLYVALSLKQTCTFVTADEKLVNAVANDLPNILWLGDWTSSM